MDNRHQPTVKNTNIKPNKPTVPLLVGAGTAGILETAFFHPIDTAITRLQASQKKIFYKGQSVYDMMRAFSQTLFKDLHNKNALVKASSLYDGASFAFILKGLQRTAKFGGQQIVSSELNHYLGPQFKECFGEKRGKVLLEAMSGSVTAFFASAFLPFDNLKTKYQHQKLYYQQQGILHLIKTEKFNLYNGLGVTLLRNIPGAFILFGTSTAVKEKFFHLEKYEDATLKQNMIAAGAASVATIFFTNGLDVLKTRVQTKSGSISVMATLQEIIKHEGPSALFKSMALRMATVVPKLTFALGLSQSLPKIVEQLTSPAPSADSQNKLKR